MLGEPFLRMSRDISDQHSTKFAIPAALNFVRRNILAVIAISAVLLTPCFWHSRIQAGDLGSHVYNAWLGQLIESHQVSGLVIARQWNNVLFDVLLLHAGNHFGFVAAEKIVVSFAVLVFFWGAFSFLAEAAGKPPWKLTPFLFVLAYGYVFHMGFMNYYLSLGLAFFALALAWRGGAGNWLCALALSIVSLVAHPVGFVLCAAISAYVALWRRLSAERRPILPLLAVISAVLLKFYFIFNPALDANWREPPYARLLGQDQVDLFGHRFIVLSRVVLVWAMISAIAGIYDWIFRTKIPAPAIRIAIELYF